jgi:hypothetical protein
VLAVKIKTTSTGLVLIGIGSAILIAAAGAKVFQIRIHAGEPLCCPNDVSDGVVADWRQRPVLLTRSSPKSSDESGAALAQAAAS